MSGLGRVFASVTAVSLVAGVVLFAPLSQAAPMDYPPAPVPTATATPVPTPQATPIPSPTPTPTPLATPIQAPTKPLKPGTAQLIVDGQAIEVTVTPMAENGTVVISGGSINLTISGLGTDGGGLPLLTDGSLLIVESGDIKVTGTGFSPNSVITLYLFSEPINLGQWTTNGKGQFTATVPVPAGLEPGHHTAQAVGVDKSGQTLTANIALTLLTKKPPSVKQRVGSTVYFDELASALRPADKKQLDKLVAQLPDGARKVRVTVAGYVQPSATTANDMSLSNARAKAVAKYLKDHGVTGAYIVAGHGISSAPGSQGRQAQVRIVLTVVG